MADAHDQFIRGVFKFVPVPTVQQFIGNAQEGSRQAVLQVKNIEAGNAPYGIPVALILLHYFIIPGDTPHLHNGEY